MNNETTIFLSSVIALFFVLLAIAGFVSGNAKDDELYGFWFFFTDDNNINEE